MGGGLKTGHIIAISIAGFVLLVGLAAVIACIVIRRKRGRRPHRVYIDHHDDDEKGSRVALHPFGDRMVGGGEQKYYNQDHDRRSFFEHKVTVIPFLTESTQKNLEPGDHDKGGRSFDTSSTLPGSPVEADLSLLPLSLLSPYEQDDIASTSQETSIRERERPSLPPLNTVLRAGNWHSSPTKPGLPFDLTPTASPSISNVALDHHHHEDVDGEEEEAAGRDSPSMYSQSSASVLFNMISSSLHRGPSMMSYASGTFDLQPIIHESPFDASWTGRTDLPQPQTSLLRKSTDGLERQSTVVIAGLLKSRQRQRQQLPKDVDVDTNDSDELFSHPSTSAVSHIERAGSIIKPIRVTGAGVAAGVTHAAAENASTTREPYGRRFKRMAAEREAAASFTPTHPVS